MYIRRNCVTMVVICRYIVTCACSGASWYTYCILLVTLVSW